MRSQAAILSKVRPNTSSSSSPPFSSISSSLPMSTANQLPFVSKEGPEMDYRIRITNPKPNALIKSIVIGADSNNTKIQYVDELTFDKRNQKKMHLIALKKLHGHDVMMSRPEIKLFGELLDLVEYINFTTVHESHYERPLLSLLANNINKIVQVLAQDFAEPELAQCYLVEASKDRATKILSSLEKNSALFSIFQKISVAGIHPLQMSDAQVLLKHRVALDNNPAHDYSTIFKLQPNYPATKSTLYYTGQVLDVAIANFCDTFTVQLRAAAQGQPPVPAELKQEANHQPESKIDLADQAAAGNTITTASSSPSSSSSLSIGSAPSSLPLNLPLPLLSLVHAFSLQAHSPSATRSNLAALPDENAVETEPNLSSLNRTPR